MDVIPKAEEHVSRIVSIQIVGQLGIDEGEQRVQVAQLILHASLVDIEVSYLERNSLKLYHFILTVEDNRRESDLEDKNG